MTDEQMEKLLGQIADGQTWTLAVLGALVHGYAELPARVKAEYEKLVGPTPEEGVAQPGSDDNGDGTKENT